MRRSAYLGEVEQLVLMALMQLGQKAHCADIWREIEDRSKRRILGTTVYAALDRLEEKAFVESEWGEATPVKGGRAKKFFSISEKGLKAVRHSLRSVNKMQEGLELGFATK